MILVEKKKYFLVRAFMQSRVPCALNDRNLGFGLIYGNCNFFGWFDIRLFWSYSVVFRTTERLRSKYNHLILIFFWISLLMKMHRELTWLLCFNRDVSRTFRTMRNFRADSEHDVPLASNTYFSLVFFQIDFTFYPIVIDLDRWKRCVLGGLKNQRKKD